jgi:hypothetical protein
MRHCPELAQRGSHPGRVAFINPLSGTYSNAAIEQDKMS